MKDRSRIYQPNFSSADQCCNNCGQVQSHHDYVNGEFFCVAQTRDAMNELMATVAACEKAWQWDTDHGFLTTAEVARYRAEHES
jgi:hypothetical protein